jgi:hypothetical protein
MGYDNVNGNVRHERSFVTVAGSGELTTKFVMYQKAKLQGLHALVVTAGTSDSPGCKLDVYVGTSSVGILAVGTATAGATVTADLGGIAVPSMNPVHLKSGTDATSVVNATVEYNHDWDAVQS